MQLHHKMTPFPFSTHVNIKFCKQLVLIVHLEYNFFLLKKHHLKGRHHQTNEIPLSSSSHVETTVFFVSFRKFDIIYSSFLEHPQI